MAEKSFREIEAEIAEKGFSALCKEAAEAIQNVTRTLGYLEDQLNGDGMSELANEVHVATGRLIRAGLTLMDLSKKVD